MDQRARAGITDNGVDHGKRQRGKIRLEGFEEIVCWMLEGMKQQIWTTALHGIYRHMIPGAGTGDTTSKYSYHKATMGKHLLKQQSRWSTRMMAIQQHIQYLSAGHDITPLIIQYIHTHDCAFTITLILGQSNIIVTNQLAV
jgi:hypothetical protein